MTETPGFLVADQRRVNALLDGLARRIDADSDPGMRMVGILRRGAPLARALADRLAGSRGEEVFGGTLRLERYADDLTVLHDEPALGEEELSFEVEGARIVLVDDVLYSGRTFLRALRHLTAAGAREVRLAVLCRRGASEIPLRADFVGLRLDVGEANVVEVHAPPYEDEWGVRLMRREDVENG